MKLEIFDISVVVMAQDHNPTILHPSFLEFQEIVPKGWELAEPPICTPPFSIVKYKNGISFTIDNNRLQVLQAPPTKSIPDSEIPNLAIKYIEKLPHVRYTTVGINFGAILYESEPGKYLMNKFLKRGTWNEDETTMKTLGLKLVYPFENGILSLSCDPGNLKKGEAAQIIRGIIVKANYHIELGDGNVLSKAKETILTFPDKFQHLQKVMKRIFNTEE